MVNFCHLTFGPHKNKNERTHTQEKLRVDLALTAGDREASSLFNVLSDRESSSQHSALFCTDFLISCSVLCLCSAGFGKDVSVLSYSQFLGKDV